MSGGRVPYHLRTNKAVDRYVFVDLLLRIHAYRSLAKYTYVGFGGPFLEDFRLVHDRLGLSKLVSIEADDDVLSRQKFNKPLSNIRCLLMTSGDFITTYNTKNHAIVWLDYANAREQRAQIEETQNLLTKLRRHDVLKITLNANPDTLGSTSAPVADRRRSRKAKVKELLGDFLPNEFSDELVDNRAGFAQLLYRATLKATHDAALTVPKRRFLILTAFRYADGPNQMLTIAGIVLDDKEEKRFLKRSGVDKWNLAIGTSLDPILIEVPALSVRERLFVDARLPRMSGKRMTQALGFHCGDDEVESANMLDSYARFYRHMPYFSRIVP